MSRRPSSFTQIPAHFLPFSEAASDDLPMGQLLRLSLFQVSVGMATVTLLGTLNRVMIVELGVAATIVALMIALLVLIALSGRFWGSGRTRIVVPLAAGRSPISVRVIWQMGGLAVMPFAAGAERTFND